MQHIDAHLITTSLPARISYLQSFLQFSPSTDGSLIHATKPVLAPLVNTIVDAVYEHLLKFDITAAAFAKPQAAGQRQFRPDELPIESDNIKVRKDFLKGYLIRLASNTNWAPDAPFWAYLDKVGKAHTGTLGDAGLATRKGKPPLFVEYRDINLLLGWVETAVTDIVMGVEALDVKTKVAILKALNKYWWIQNDLFSRHYISEGGNDAEEAQVNGSV
jgi:hypothetical protein